MSDARNEPRPPRLRWRTDEIGTGYTVGSNGQIHWCGNLNLASKHYTAGSFERRPAVADEPLDLEALAKQILSGLPIDIRPLGFDDSDRTLAAIRKVLEANI